MCWVFVCLRWCGGVGDFQAVVEICCYVCVVGDCLRELDFPLLAWFGIYGRVVLCLLLYGWELLLAMRFRVD